jgi:hypothetical protein
MRALLTAESALEVLSEEEIIVSSDTVAQGSHYVRCADRTTPIIYLSFEPTIRIIVVFYIVRSGL